MPPVSRAMAQKDSNQYKSLDFISLTLALPKNVCCWCDHFHVESCRWVEPTKNINFLELGFSWACMQSEFEQDLYIIILWHLSGRWKHFTMNGIRYRCHKDWEKTKNKKDSSLLTFKLSLKIKYIDFFPLWLNYDPENRSRSLQLYIHVHDSYRIINIT